MQSGPHDLVKNGKTVTYAPPFRRLTTFLEESAQRYGNKQAIVYEDLDGGQTSVMTYEELDRATQALAARFRERYRLRPGDRLAYAFANSPQVILVNFAAWRSGLVTVPLDITRDTPERMRYKLSLTGTKLLLVPQTPGLTGENRLKSELQDLRVDRLGLSDLLSELPATSRSAFAPGNLDRDCLILFTSGTTSKPKGVRLTLTNLIANAAAIADWMRFDVRERFHILLPLHHINSVTFTTTTFLVGGTVILSSRYSKSNFWKLMAKHRATGASIVPTIAYDLLSETASFARERKQLGSVRRIQIGSAPVQPSVIEAFMRAYGIPLIQGYGQTETSLRSTGIPMDLTPQQFAKARKSNSVGTELPTTNVTVLDEGGRQAGEGQVGEICVRGPVVMSGYLKDPIATREAFTHGWFHSGDMGYWKILFGRKFFFLLGRTKEIIKKGGVLVSPLAIENALLTEYPQLQQVYAVGFPDPRLGEEIGIIAVPKTTGVLPRLLSQARGGKLRRLKPFEYPRAALAVTEDQLPKTSTGKVQRMRLKEIFGPQLLESARTIASTEKLTLRRIGPEETVQLKQALSINNKRWGKHLTSTLAQFRERANHALLIAALDHGNLKGSLSAMRIGRQDLDSIGAEGHWANTWEGVTGKGTLCTHTEKGDCLLAVAISVDPTGLEPEAPSSQQPGRTLKKLTPARLSRYLLSDLDPVIRFHRRPKGGYARGARLVTVIPKGRVKDRDALGYNLLMHYPKLVKQPTLTAGAGIGTQLIEAALIWAWNARLTDVFVYTRPSHLFRHFKA